MRGRPRSLGRPTGREGTFLSASPLHTDLRGTAPQPQRTRSPTHEGVLRTLSIHASGRPGSPPPGRGCRAERAIAVRTKGASAGEARCAATAVARRYPPLRCGSACASSSPGSCTAPPCRSACVPANKGARVACAATDTRDVSCSQDGACRCGCGVAALAVQRRQAARRHLRVSRRLAVRQHAEEALVGWAAAAAGRDGRALPTTPATTPARASLSYLRGELSQLRCHSAAHSAESAGDPREAVSDVLAQAELPLSAACLAACACS